MRLEDCRQNSGPCCSRCIQPRRQADKECYGKTKKKETGGNDGAGAPQVWERLPEGRERPVKKSESLSRRKRSPSRRDWAEAIHELRREHSLELLLKKTGMARTTFYYHTKRLAEPDGYDDARTAIRNIYDCHKGRYGYRRITSQLRNDGISLNHKTVQRLMKKYMSMMFILVSIR